MDKKPHNLIDNGDGQFILNESGTSVTISGDSQFEDSHPAPTSMEDTLPLAERNTPTAEPHLHKKNQPPAKG